jgi:hypothetical protein
LPSSIQTNIMYAVLSHACYVLRESHRASCEYLNKKVQIMKLLIITFSPNVLRHIQSVFFPSRERLSFAPKLNNG